MKKKLLLISSMVSALLTTTAIVVFTARHVDTKAINTYDKYTLTLDSHHPFTNSDHASGEKTYTTSNGTDLVFSYNNISKGGLAKFEGTDSFVKNKDAINGLTSIDFVISEGDLIISYGYSYNSYDVTSSALSTSGSYFFNYEYPSFFRLTTSEECVLTSLTIHYSCSESVNPYEELLPPANPNAEHTYHEKAFVDFPEYTDADATPGLTYTLSDDGSYYIVDNYNNTMQLAEPDNILIFPNEHNGLPVREIGYLGFVERWYIFGVYIPENITHIQNEAFEMTGLTSVYWNAVNCEDFPARNGIFYPGDSHNHQNIDLVIGPSVERVPARLLFPNAMNPTILPVVNSVSFAKNSICTEIGEYAFYGLENLDHIYLPDTLESIGDYAFYNLGVDEIDLPSSLQHVGKSAFMFNEASHIRFPNSLKELDNEAFNYSNNLVEALLGNTKVTSIGENSFSHSPNMNYVSFPNTLARIEEEAFFMNESLISINLPDSLTHIGQDAFKDCSDVEYIYLGRNLKTISDGAFSNLTKVSCLAIQSESLNDFTNNNKIFLNLSKDVNGSLVFIKNEVSHLPNNLFYPTSVEERLPSIKTLILPYSLESIGDNAFFNLSIDKVDYFGSASQYSNISIGENNDGLSNAKARAN